MGNGLLPVLGEATVNDLDQHYTVAVLAQAGRVAARKTRRLRIEPRDDWRWGYLLELDHRTAMPLELRVLGPQGMTLEHVQCDGATEGEGVEVERHTADGAEEDDTGGGDVGVIVMAVLALGACVFCMQRKARAAPADDSAPGLGMPEASEGDGEEEQGRPTRRAKKKGARAPQDDGDDEL